MTVFLFYFGQKFLVFGTGYAWTKPYLIINVGDRVHWNWKAPAGVAGIKYRVQQVADPLSIVPVGFDSGDSTAFGKFDHQFNAPGVFHYWSGFVDASEKISFRGVINVVDSVDKEMEVDVRVNAYSAQKCHFPFDYNGKTYNTCTNETVGYNWCSPTPNFHLQRLKCDIGIFV